MPKKDRMKKALIIINVSKDESMTLAQEIAAYLTKKGVQHISFCFRNKSHKEKIHISIFSDSRVFVEWESATNQWNGGSFTGTMR